MKKKLIYISAFIAGLFLLYTIVWFIITISISYTMNKQYANRKLSTQLITNSKVDYYMQFSQVSWYGFPFKLGVQIHKWCEEGSDIIIELHSPIKLGYDLLKQSAFIEYSGKAISQYKKTISGYEPIKTESGTIFNTNNYSLIIKIPSSIKLFKVLLHQRNLFEIINFIKEIKLSSNKTQIFDLYDQTKIYDEDYTSLSLTFEKKKYYTNLADFKNNVPQKLNIYYATKIIESNIINRKLPSGILLYLFTAPFACNIEGKFYIKTNKSLLNDVPKDYEINIISAKTSSPILALDTTLLYRNKAEDNNYDTQLQISTKIDLKPGFSDAIMYHMQHWIPYLQTSTNNKLWLEELVHINNNHEKFNLAELENRQYLFNLDMNTLSRGNDITRAQINNLSLFSNHTGFRATMNSKISKLQEFDLHGHIMLNNYIKPTELIAHYILNLGKFKTFSEESRTVYTETIKTLLKLLSDYPDSTSDDLSFEYSLQSYNIKKGKIGTVEINKVVPLYYLTLYNKAADHLGPNDSLAQRMQELVPDFNEHPDFLKQLIFQPMRETDNTSTQETIQ
ncbi:hypothetical protein [Candidatus Tisiphia endosymbiont of Nemotelus uliginosus]|uniref:hypothetical protein n=1 Tax=Candidatus Tisiphia endosymbiont of Nemotelus uliginosus TaxID=3077926 RepID=UPI0035C8D265